MGALICCYGCQFFVEGRRRHPRRGSLGCVSTALDKTTVCFFAAQGFFVRHFAFSMRCSFERCALPQRHILNVGMFFSTDHRRLFHENINGHCWRAVLQRLYASSCSVESWIVTHKRKHPNAIQKRRTAFGKTDALRTTRRKQVRRRRSRILALKSWQGVSWK